MNKGDLNTTNPTMKPLQQHDEEADEKPESQQPPRALANEEEDAHFVQFEENDPENPRNWPTWRKWIIVALVATMHLLTYVISLSHQSWSS